MTRGRTISPSRLLCTGLTLFVATVLHAAARSPNVILIMTDDQGYGDMSCHGNPYIKTPNIDRLHAESIRLTDFHVDPMCTPTRAALMTGRYSTRTGAWLTYAGRNHLRRDEVTMAEIFKSSGYTTAIFGKWHLGDGYPFRPTDRGFDESLVHGGGVVGEAPDYWGNDYYDDVYFRNGKQERVSGYCTDVWFDEAAEFITKNRKRPFFLYLPTNAPHGPWHVPSKYVDRYRKDPEIPEHRALFYGMIASIDENIGRLRSCLAALELADHTIVIFLTDNGGTVGAQQLRKLPPGRTDFTVSGYNAGMRGSKTSAYEGGHRAACFVHWERSGFNTGRDIDTLSAHFDLLPTLIDWCGLKVPRELEFDGTSLAPLFAGEAGSWPNRTLFVHNQGRRARDVYDGLPMKYKDYSVMTERWRLVGKELYDYRSDPGQTRDVGEEHPDVVRRLLESYETWWTDVTRRASEFCPLAINPEKQKTVTLTCQSWHGDSIPYNQHHVRSGQHSNGYWMVDVEKPGIYHIELRRWPRELDLAISETHEHEQGDPSRYDVNARLLRLPSRQLDVKTARLKVSGFDETKTVAQRDKAVRFEVALASGEQSIQTWFTTTSGRTYGAYFVYIAPGHDSESK